MARIKRGRDRSAVIACNKSPGKVWGAAAANEGKEGEIKTSKWAGSDTFGKKMMIF